MRLIMFCWAVDWMPDMKRMITLVALCSIGLLAFSHFHSADRLLSHPFPRHTQATAPTRDALTRVTPTRNTPTRRAATRHATARHTPTSNVLTRNTATRNSLTRINSSLEKGARRHHSVPMNCNDLKYTAKIDNFHEFCRQLHPLDQKLNFNSNKDLPLRRGIALYLVQGEAQPSQFWLNTSARSDSYLIWLSWRTKVPIVIRKRTVSSYIFFPQSNFNRGRNRLIREGLRLERKQKWKFEYVVFADEDTQAMVPVSETTLSDIKVTDQDADMQSTDIQDLKTYPKSIAALNYLLFFYRPARAGIQTSHPTFPRPPYFSCVATPSIDPQLEAFHRTALQAMLLYNSKYDDVNIWFSAAILNMMAHVLLGPYSVQFRHLVNDAGAKDQKHANYPSDTSATYKHTAFCYVKRCLAPGARRAEKLFIDENSYGVLIGIRERPGETDPLPCLQMPSNVDYSSTINSRVVEKNWLQPGGKL